MMLPVVVPVTAALLLLLLPVILPIIAVLQARDRRWLETAAAVTACGRCGATLGQAALTGADASWSEYVTALHRDNPDARFRLARELWALCSVCGARYGLDGERLAFTRLTYRDAEGAWTT